MERVKRQFGLWLGPTVTSDAEFLNKRPTVLRKVRMFVSICNERYEQKPDGSQCYFLHGRPKFLSLSGGITEAQYAISCMSGKHNV